MNGTTFISKDLHNQLPKLRIIAPLTWSICWIFVIINTFIAYALAFIYHPAVPIAVVNDVIDFRFWAGVFFFLGVGNTINLLRNKWRRIKWFLIFGLTVKLIWLFALVIRTFQQPSSTILLTVLWTCFALVQAATFIWFLPSLQTGREHDK